MSVKSTINFPDWSREKKKKKNEIPRNRLPSFVGKPCAVRPPVVSGITDSAHYFAAIFAHHNKYRSVVPGGTIIRVPREPVKRSGALCVSDGPAEAWTEISWFFARFRNAPWRVYNGLDGIPVPEPDKKKTIYIIMIITNANITIPSSRLGAPVLFSGSRILRRWDFFFFHFSRRSS